MIHELAFHQLTEYLVGRTSIRSILKDLDLGPFCMTRSSREKRFLIQCFGDIDRIDLIRRH